jgi:putative Holliday junction resolvase
MRILGIDFGDKSIGLAVSDQLLLTAQSLGRYLTLNEEEDKKFFKELVNEYSVGEIVIGLPLRMDGSSGTRVEKTKEFAIWLGKTLDLPIVFWDERLTTQQAYKILHKHKMNGRKKKKLKDQVSATIILSSYLESRQVKSHDP